MDKTTRIAIVEDNKPQRTVLLRLLEKSYAVAGFENGQAFLDDDSHFDAVLLDIEMPDLNGYDTCRRFREQPRGNEVPVIFVSAHDTTPERLAAYDAGGDDFLTKPIVAHELQHKLDHALALRARLHTLATQSSDAQRVAFSAMSSMGDLGVVIDFLRRSAQAGSYSAIAARLLAAMKDWGLRGAVQVRGRYDHAVLNSDGEMTGIQASILEKMRDMGRIFEMGSRAVINFEHVSLLVENLPVDDPDKLGRLRDHLGVLAESADMRLVALDAAIERDLQKQAIEGVLDELRSAMRQATDQTSIGQQRNHAALLEAIEQLARTLQTLGLTESQSAYLEDLVRHAMDEIGHFLDDVAHNESQFADVIARLQRLAQADYRL